jgi:hypothetical protein
MACGRDSPPKPPEFAEVLPNLPLPPQATFVSKAGGADALQLTVRSPVQTDLVVAYYRALFKRNGWRLVNDAKDQEGSVVILAEHDGPPIWVRIRKDDAGSGTLVDITGARMSQKRDSAKAPAPPAVSKPTS